MNEDSPIESGSLTDEEKYELRIEPKANPGELYRPTLWYLLRYLSPALIPIFFWMAKPHYGPAWFAAFAVLTFVGFWGILRKERSVDTTNVDRELVFYLLAAVSGGFATASCLFVVFLMA